MNYVLFLARASFRRRVPLLLLLPLPLAACGGDDRVLAAEAPFWPGDSIAPGGGDSLTPAPPQVPVDSTGLPVDSTPPAPAPTAPPGAHAGIPFGPFGLPAKLYSDEFNATSRALGPEVLLPELEAARRAGTRVVIRLVGGHSRYRKKNGSFSMEEWKARLDRYRDIDFSSYIEDGTVVGHFILDEPHDKSNWGGTLVPLATIDEMARYSKELWPTMPTIVRGWPAYLKGYNYKYLDAAWAQYSERFGPISTFMSENVRDAKASGLALVVGLNLLAGGTRGSGITGYVRGMYGMSPAQVKTWGAALLADPYVCAFLSWKYNEGYFSRPAIKSALAELSSKAKHAENRGCRKR